MQRQIMVPPTPSTSLQDTNSRWLAIVQRNHSFHSSFLYGVKSTKIYCRPTCTARLARRANVVFYDAEEQARRDGFRPCKRCKPDIPDFLGERQAVVSRAIALLRTEDNHLMWKSGLKELADRVGVTPSYLCRAFKKTMGVTLGTYILEFERDPRATMKYHPVQSFIRPDKPDSDTSSMGVCLQAPGITAEVTPVCPMDLPREATQDDSGRAEEALDFSFYLNELVWDETFMANNIPAMYADS